MTSHPSLIPGPGMSNMSSMSPEPSQWTGGEQNLGIYANNPQIDETNPQYMNQNFVGGFSSMQKKTTRDGQPTKRRGPKPDSKPAQTRRQELNRQAQRTHRERKEQYIKALEIEVSRLRETFAMESNHSVNMLKQRELMLRDSQQEVIILKDMLAARGMPFETELESRKAGAGMTSGRENSSLGPQHIPTRPYQSPMQGPPSTAGFTTLHDQNLYQSNSVMSVSGHSPGTTHHSHSPPEILEQTSARSPEPISDLPGIFEREPQLGVDFILALESTCRDHEEYLVRRSLASPNDPDEALFSGHALMASCPPPSHIEKVPAQKGGLEPTYPHQAAQVPMSTLQNLLNLSQKIKADGFVEGGQVTPIMALQSLRGHQNYASLTREDVVGMIESIRNKVRCYGFGAVMEDFELRDALSGIFATKPETYEGIGASELDDMYG